MSLGPVMLGLNGFEVTPEEQGMLRHPAVGGVILFARNYHSPEQIASLIHTIRMLRQPALLVAVDQEGGRVQRFRAGLTSLPALGRIGEEYERSPTHARHLASLAGWLMAAELRAVGVDLSFTPVLDLDRGVSQIIGDRAFHSNPDVVVELACAYMEGMGKAGMEAVGKHFPGHGGVVADSHLELPLDDRPLADIVDEDMGIFERMIRYGLAAIMVSHVVYSEVDSRPAGFSARWLQDMLRQRLGFQGAIISDDLDMAAACTVGSHAQRAKAALAAGCDLLLACNDRQGASAILESVNASLDALTQTRLKRLYGRNGLSLMQLRKTPTWKTATALIERYDCA